MFFSCRLTVGIPPYPKTFWHTLCWAWATIWHRPWQAWWRILGRQRFNLQLRIKDAFPSSMLSFQLCSGWNAFEANTLAGETRIRLWNHAGCSPKEIGVLLLLLELLHVMISGSFSKNVRLQLSSFFSFLFSIFNSWICNATLTIASTPIGSLQERPCQFLLCSTDFFGSSVL